MIYYNLWIQKTRLYKYYVVIWNIFQFFVHCLLTICSNYYCNLFLVSLPFPHNRLVNKKSATKCTSNDSFLRDSKDCRNFMRRQNGCKCQFSIFYSSSLAALIFPQDSLKSLLLEERVNKFEKLIFLRAERKLFDFTLSTFGRKKKLENISFLYWLLDIRQTACMKQ